MAEGPGADCQREGLPLLLPLGQPGLPQGQAESSSSHLAGTSIALLSYVRELQLAM